MDDGAPTLEVGFAIDTGDSFGSLTQLDELIDRATANAVAEFAKVEKASGGMLDLAGPTARITSFGNAATKELRDAARELSRVEKAGESMSRQLERQAANFGKTREEIRATKAETAALAAEQQGLTDLAGRLRSQEAALAAAESAATAKARAEVEALAEAKRLAAAAAAAAAEVEAQAIRSAARAHEMFEARVRQGVVAMREQEAAAKALARDQAAAAMQAEAAAASKLATEHARLAEMVRASHAAQESDHASLERLRASTDPLYAATKRLNDEIAESTRLYHAGVSSQAEYARQQAVLTGRLQELEQAQTMMATAAGRGRSSLTQLSFQLNDVATMASLGAPPMQIFASQAGQIFQVAQMAEGGVKGFAKEIGALALRFAPLVAVAAVAGVAIYRWKEQINENSGLKEYADGLGLTQQEMKKLGDVSVTTGDLIAGTWKTISDALGLRRQGQEADRLSVQPR